MIIGYSLVIAIVLFNLSMVAVALLRQKTGYLAKYSTFALVLLMLFGALRVALPFSFPQLTVIVQSFDILPSIAAALEADILPGAGRFELGTLLLALWVAGSVTMLLRTVRKVRRFNQLRACYMPADNLQAVKIAQKLKMKRISIIVSPDVGTPFVTGIFKAWIYLPEMHMPDDKLEMVLRHEYQHFKSCDFLIKAFYLMLSVVFWWNPFVHIFQRDLDALLEIRCDEAVTKHMNQSEKTAYLETLVHIMKHIKSRNATNPASAPTGFALVRTVDRDEFIAQRFRLITSNKKSTGRQIISVVLVVLIFLASFMVIIQPAHNMPAEDMEGAFRICPESSHILLTSDGRFKLYVDGQFVSELPEIAIETNPVFGALQIINEKD